MYLPRSLLAALRGPEELPEPAGPLQERLARMARPARTRPVSAHMLASIRRIRWRAISRLRRQPPAEMGGVSWT